MPLWHIWALPLAEGPSRSFEERGINWSPHKILDPPQSVSQAKTGITPVWEIMFKFEVTAQGKREDGGLSFHLPPFFFLFVPRQRWAEICKFVCEAQSPQMTHQFVVIERDSVLYWGYASFRHTNHSKRSGHASGSDHWMKNAFSFILSFSSWS